jgi:propanol-preferring alcohol dehydrogenase
MVARGEALVGIPKELDAYEGTPLLCAGRTVFGALKSSGAQGGDVVAIHGIGGLGHLAIQYSRNLGFKTVALSRGTDKEELSLKLGAHSYLDTSSGGAAEELQKMGGARVILCTAPNSRAIAELIDGLGRDGKIIIVSAPVSGNIEDAIHFSLLSGAMPMVETFPLEQAAIAFDKMMAARVRFRAVLKIA